MSQRRLVLESIAGHQKAKSSCRVLEDVFVSEETSWCRRRPSISVKKIERIGMTMLLNSA